ncbi:rhodanese-like domain-containing protein [Methanolobus sp. ZRKC3]|uniref:rhodanese-like domain-containing protein n=1 Tax=Methanolobus sp. ZRKC3 TaxID=3125786 RepID=UPI00325066EE
MNINLIELPDRLDEIPEGSKIQLYCQFDVMSRNAGKKLVRSGFSDVYNMLGGFRTWYKAGYPFVSEI